MMYEVIKFLLVYIPILIAFAIGFHMLLPHSDIFNQFLTACLNGMSASWAACLAALSISMSRPRSIYMSPAMSLALTLSLDLYLHICDV